MYHARALGCKPFFISGARCVYVTYGTVLVHSLFCIHNYVCTVHILEVPVGGRDQGEARETSGDTRMGSNK